MTGDATKNSDIFISYSSKDRGRIAPLVEALEGVGWAVWWDRKIPVGKTYNEVIEAALNSCGCVIVVWSENSIESEYVRDETSEAKSQHKLVPVLIDQVKPPLEFRRIQAANLLNWAPEAESAEFDELLDAITDMIGKPESTRDSLDQAEVGDEDEDVDDDEDDDDDEDEDEDEDELESDDWFDKGYEAQERNQHKKALRCYTRAIDLDPDSAETYCNRGNAYDSLMRYGDALKDYRKAIRLDPNDADIYLNRGNTYSTLERFEEALEDYSAALKLEPDDAYVYGQRGFVLHRLERYEEALRDYDMALKLAPDDANTFHHNRGDAFFELGRYDAALREFGA
ncbi:MAG: tetratricopeptide repeat protein, partial [candidate division Zixibacteria bacterium]|nr:tetratricopeptide repeat protein [candidate division Zixibacteria bacterium]